MRSLLLVFTLTFALSCSGADEQKQAPAPSPPAAKPADAAAAAGAVPAPAVLDPYACKTADDCMSSCMHGAVNTAWYREQYPGGELCKDGCVRKGTDAALCIDGGCVSYYKGERNDACTRREIELSSVPGPAHVCNSDADCLLSCSLGAVNRHWYERRTNQTECDDGCEGPDSDPPRCEERLCVAYRAGKKDGSCTRRSVW